MRTRYQEQDENEYQQLTGRTSSSAQVRWLKAQLGLRRGDMKHRTLYRNARAVLVDTGSSYTGFLPFLVRTNTVSKLSKLREFATDVAIKTRKLPIFRESLGWSLLCVVSYSETTEEAYTRLKDGSELLLSNLQRSGMDYSIVDL